MKSNFMDSTHNSSKMMKSISFKCLFSAMLLWGTVTVPALSQSVAINEVMAVNSTVIQDDDGDYSDWIELYNYGTEAIDLTGFGLSDNATLPFKWQFPPISIQPDSYLLIWASNKDRKIDGQPLHTSFAVSSGGEDIVLTDSYGVLVDMIPAIPIPATTSYGRFPNGTGNLRFFPLQLQMAVTLRQIM